MTYVLDVYGALGTVFYLETDDLNEALGVFDLCKRDIKEITIELWQNGTLLKSARGA